MSKYQIVSAPTNDGLFGINPDWLIKDSETGKYFNGYDFMGSVEWVNIGEAYCMSKDEAQGIVKDLEASDEPAEPEKPEAMKRIDVLRALAAAKNAFNAELKKRGIYCTDWNMNDPHKYKLFTSNDSLEYPVTYIAEINFQQKVYSEGQF